MGAEVQRPLATVVIGGIITSTFLTLLVVPARMQALIGDPDPAVVKRAMEAMFKMSKLDIAALEAARAG